MYKKINQINEPLVYSSSGAWIRTKDLRVMSPTSCHCSTPHRVIAHFSSGQDYSTPAGWRQVGC